MSKTLSRLFLSVLFPFFLSAGIVQAETTLNMDTLTFSNPFYDAPEDSSWDAHMYRTMGWLENSEEIGSALLSFGHDKLKMSEQSSLARATYLLTAGQLNYRFQLANAIVFGHEMAHFQFSIPIGGHNFRFHNFDTGTDHTLSEVYWNVFWKMDPEVTATKSISDWSDPDARIMVNNSGLNLQQKIGAEWTRSSLYEDKNVFDVPTYLINKSHILGYAYNDKINEGNQTISGDVINFVNHLKSEGYDADIDKVVSTAAISYALSPTTWQIGHSLYDYIATGDITYEPFYVNVSKSKLSWDISNYMNANSYTVAPVVYIKKSIHEFPVLIGIGTEFSVMGENKTELSASLRSSVNNHRFDISASGSSEGHFISLNYGYSVSDRFVPNISYITTSGDSLEGSRMLPTDKSLLWAGVSITF